MNTHLDEKKLFDLLGKETEIPVCVQERLEHTYDQIRQTSKKKEDNMLHIHKRHHSKTMMIIAAVVAILTVSAMAVGLTHSEFIQSAFGNGIESREEETVTNPGGSSYTLPASERVDIDADHAEVSIGDYIADVGTTVEANGFTFTIKSYVMDANGIACLTYTLENPEGLDILHDAGGGCVYYYDERYQEDGFRLFEPGFETTSGSMLNYHTYLDSSSSTDILATLVVYITPFDAVSENDGITMTIDGYSEGDDRELAAPTLATVNIPASSKVTATKFSCGKMIAYVSPVGIMVTSSTFDEHEDLIHEILVEYADGSEYVVESEIPYIYNVTGSSTNGQVVWEAFNRLVDVDNVASISINGNKLTP